MAPKLFVINGVNLGTLGRRSPEVYGTLTLYDIEKLLKDEFPRVQFEFRQTDYEGEMIGFIREAAESTGIAINPGAWTHYSYALRDAGAQLTAPLVEVHISDPKSRPEEFRHHSVITAYAAKEIAGQGLDGYRQALEFIASTLDG